MRALALLAALMSVILACRNDSAPDGEDGPDLKRPSLPDLAPPPAKCSAAKGLSGDVLNGLCVDLATTDAATLTNLGFNLGAAMVNCMGWEVANGKLQPKGINTTVGAVTCALSFPAITIDPKYTRVTLALVHQATIPGPSQQATIALPAATPRPLWVWVDSSTPVDQRTIIEIGKTKIPPPTGAPFQPAIQLYAPGTTTAPTWTISSIAVLGNP